MAIILSETKAQEDSLLPELTSFEVAFAVSENPADEAILLFQKSMLLISANRFEEAGFTFDRIKTADLPNEIQCDFWKYRSYSYLETANSGKALSGILTIPEQCKTDTSIQFLKALIYLENGRFDSFLSETEKLIVDSVQLNKWQDLARIKNNLFVPVKTSFPVSWYFRNASPGKGMKALAMFIVPVGIAVGGFFVALPITGVAAGSYLFYHFYTGAKNSVVKETEKRNRQLHQKKKLAGYDLLILLEKSYSNLSLPMR